MRYIAIFFIIIVCIMLLGGCVYQMTKEEIALESAQSKMFMQVSNEKYGSVIVDKETKVMYWMSNGGYSYGILTLLVNPDGTPRIWEVR